MHFTAQIKDSQSDQNEVSIESGSAHLHAELTKLLLVLHLQVPDQAAVGGEELGGFRVADLTHPARPSLPRYRAFRELVI